MKYIYHRPNGYYYFRMRVPADLQPLLCVKYLSKTLSVRSINGRKVFQDRLFIAVRNFLFELRKYKPSKDLAEQSLANALNQVFQDESTLICKDKDTTSERHCYALPAKVQYASAPPLAGKRMSEVIKEYCGEKIRGNNWTPKTQLEFTAYLKVFLEIVGDIDITQLNYQILRDYKNALAKLPPNRKKSRKFRNKTIKEILAMPDSKVKPMHFKTANKNLFLVASMLSWSIKQGYLEKNYAEGLSFPIKTRPSEERLPYSMGEIAKITELINGFDRRKRPEKYWIPLVSMYSAMRMGEICQLHKEDIKEINGVWSFDINFKNGKKKIKTKSGERCVPVHRHLISLGLIDFIKSSKSGHIWKNLKHDDKHGYTHNFQRWFGHLNRKQVTTDSRKTFHSLRHNVADFLKQGGVSGEIIEELLGHELKSQSTGRYATRFRPDVLKPILDTVDYGVLPVPYYSKP